MKKVSILKVFMVLIMFFIPGVSWANYIVIGHVNTTDAMVTAEVVKQILERKRFNVALKEGPPSLMFDMLAEREIDLLVSGWLPNADQKIWDNHESNLIKVGILFEGPKRFWAIPKYLNKKFNYLYDLNSPEVIQKLENKLYIQKSNVESPEELLLSLKAAGLDKSEKDLKKIDTQGVLELLKNEEWFLIRTWRPNYLARVADLRLLEDSQSLEDSSDVAYLLANSDSYDDLKATTRSILSKIELSLKFIEDLDYALNIRKIAVHDVVRQWLASHPYTTEYWLEPDLE